MWRKAVTSTNYGRDIALLLGLILVGTFFNPNWAFSPLKILATAGAYNDHWLYLGIMLDLSDKLQYISETYFRHYSFERFSWLVPGALAYQIFPPIIANYLLKFAVYSGAVIGLYWTLRNLFGRKTALFTALCLGGYSWFLRSAGWDYMDGVGIAYFLMMVGTMVGALYAKKHATWRWLSFLTGVMACNLVATNTYWVIFLPHLLGIALWLNHHQNKRPLIPSFGLAIVGIAIVTAIYGAISYQLSGQWFFLKSSISSSSAYMGDKGLYALVTWLYKPMTPHYHVLPLLLMVAGIAWAFTRKRTTYFPIQRLLLMQTVWFYVLIIISHYVILPYLIIFLYSSYLIPAIFLWLGALVAPRLESLTEIQFNRLQISIGVLFLAPFVVSVLVPISEKWQDDTLLLAIGAWGMLVGLLFIQKKMAFVLMGGIVFFGWMSSSQIFVFDADRLRNQETFAIAIDGYEQVQDHYIRNGVRDIEYVLNSDSSSGIPFFITSSLFFDGHYYRGNYSATDTPAQFSIKQDLFRSLSFGQTSQKTVIFSRYPNTVEPFLSVYFANNRQVGYEIDKTVAVQRYDMTYYMTFLSIYPNSKTIFVTEFATVDKANLIAESGFGDIELNNGRTFRWTSEPTASMTFSVAPEQFDPNKTYQVQFWTLTPLEAEVQDSLRVSINGQELILERIPQGSDTLFQASIAGAILNRDVLELVFETDRISRPADFGYPDPRTLGIVLDWLTIELQE